MTATTMGVSMITKFPDLCISTLRSDSRSVTADVKCLACIMLEVALAKATDTLKQVKNLLSKTSEPVLKECLTICASQNESVVEDSIPNAIKNVGLDNDEAIAYEDITISNASTCEDIFAEEPNPRKSPFTASNNAVEHLVASAEGIIEREYDNHVFLEKSHDLIRKLALRSMFLCLFSQDLQVWVPSKRETQIFPTSFPCMWPSGPHLGKEVWDLGKDLDLDLCFDPDVPRTIISFVLDDILGTILPC
ncbi:hypothetical protein TEA_015692 [Camellia sinensis var. sinensis]|uniref:Pectinesterase inhibitor domain-containing protein n=1 Tax=Camellia sinensis var. sinensis TaxID=542762 RepID=A0A4S4D5T2_CAMSN|nr:hypothetical protein TEA_015692 [Camellia sinensis var. sinensis]